MASTHPEKDTAELYARYAAGLAYESLPTEVISVLKRIVLDTLGTTLAANTLGEGVRPLVDMARSAGGAAESTLIGFGQKVPAIMAALVNGGMAQALNYADNAEWGGHLGPTSVPAAFLEKNFWRLWPQGRSSNPEYRGPLSSRRATGR